MNTSKHLNRLKILYTSIAMGMLFENEADKTECDILIKWLKPIHFKMKQEWKSNNYEIKEQKII